MSFRLDIIIRFHLCIKILVEIFANIIAVSIWHFYEHYVVAGCILAQAFVPLALLGVSLGLVRNVGVTYTVMLLTLELDEYSPFGKVEIHPRKGREKAFVSYGIFLFVSNTFFVKVQPYVTFADAFAPAATLRTTMSAIYTCEHKVKPAVLRAYTFECIVALHNGLPWDE